MSQENLINKREKTRRDASRSAKQLYLQNSLSLWNFDFFGNHGLYITASFRANISGSPSLTKYAWCRCLFYCLIGLRLFIPVCIHYTNTQFAYEGWIKAPQALQREVNFEFQCVLCTLYISRFKAEKECSFHFKKRKICQETIVKI